MGTLKHLQRQAEQSGDATLLTVLKAATEQIAKARAEAQKEAREELPLAAKRQQLMSRAAQMTTRIDRQRELAKEAMAKAAAVEEELLEVYSELADLPEVPIPRPKETKPTPQASPGVLECLRACAAGQCPQAAAQKLLEMCPPPLSSADVPPLQAGVAAAVGGCGGDEAAQDAADGPLEGDGGTSGDADMKETTGPEEPRAAAGESPKDSTASGEDPRKLAIRAAYLAGAKPEEILARARQVGPRTDASRSPRRSAKQEESGET